MWAIHAGDDSLSEPVGMNKGLGQHSPVFPSPPILQRGKLARQRKATGLKCDTLWEVDSKENTEAGEAAGGVRRTSVGSDMRITPPPLPVSFAPPPPHLHRRVSSWVAVWPDKGVGWGEGRAAFPKVAQSLPIAHVRGSDRAPRVPPWSSVPEGGRPHPALRGLPGNI